MTKRAVKDHYENLVELKYQLFNSLFLTLPLDAVEQAGLLLPLLEESSHRGLAEGLDPEEILENFFASHRPTMSEEARAQFLFKVIQYVERQVVLIDALEDAAYSEIHRTEESNKLRQLVERLESDALQKEFKSILAGFGARVILTAHPTQFYPGAVLAIITDLTEAVKSNNIATARELLQQLGNTPFYQKEKPSPLDEASQLTWYLDNVFYESVGDILEYLERHLDAEDLNSESLLSVGFWPGGDRDGNPFVTAAITKEVAAKLRARIIECYHREIKAIRRRLSFPEITEKIEEIEQLFHKELTNQISACFSSPRELISILNEIQSSLEDNYQGLFVGRLVSFKRKIQSFGFHFASLDIRQDSRVIDSTLHEILETHPSLLSSDFENLKEEEKIAELFSINGNLQTDLLTSSTSSDTLNSLAEMKEIQIANGQLACHRYIISNCRGPLDVAKLVALFKLSGWDLEKLTVDIVPLFETIADLKNSSKNIKVLYDFKKYREHLERRNNKQVIMLGFSDGTKDGGYLMANWSIYSAKEALTKISRVNNIEACFFDGRGGPPARGGGSTYKFYAALGKTIESNQIQLTIQGQTISSYYGTQVGATHNLRQLLAAGLENNLYHRPDRELNSSQRELMEELANSAHQKYLNFKSHPLFLKYLVEMSTLNYYSLSNIGSRPSVRNSSDKIDFENLRAIPFVGAWGQLKQNVPGYFGLGTALKAMEEKGRLDECIDLYDRSGFFRALIGNSMQSMSKTNFSLTSYMKKDKLFGEFWELIYSEFELSMEMALKISGQSVLLEDHPGSRHSIGLRQKVVLPLLIIQQFALIKIRSLNLNDSADLKEIELYENMVIRSLFGNINASRNSA